MSLKPLPQQPAPDRNPGWGRLLGFAVAEGYLVAAATLLAIAFIPVVFGWHATVIQTGSMEPHISPGDVVVASPWEEPDPVPVGGVVQYTSPAAAEPDGVERLRLHRIVDANDDGTFVTAGDANQDVDSTPLERSQIIGQARLLIPWVGLPGFWLTTGHYLPLIGWAALTLTALVLAARGPGKNSPTPSDEEDSEMPPPENRSARHVGLADLLDSQQMDRRAALTLLGAGAAAGMLSAPVDHSSAAYTSKTGTKASWSVAKLPELSLGRAASYVLMAHETIQHSPTLGIGTTIEGSVATSPGTKIEGFWPWDISGSTDRNTTGARNARTDLLALHAALLKYPATASRASVLTGTLKPGVYTSTTGRFVIEGKLSLDSEGDPSARFIFRADSITAAANSTVVFTGGTRTENVYWRSAGDIVLGSSSLSRGIYLAGADAVIQSRGTLVGHLYALNGSVTVTRATISRT